MVAAYQALRDLREEPLVVTHGGTYECVLEQEGIDYTVIEPRMSHERRQAFVKANRVDGQAGHFYETDKPQTLYFTERLPAAVPRSWLKRLVNWIYLHSNMFMGDITIVTEAPEVLGISREDLEGWTPKSLALYHDSPRLRCAGPMYAKLFGELEDDVRRFLDGDCPKIYIALTSTRHDYLHDLVAAMLNVGVRLLVVSTVHDLPIEHPSLLVPQHLPSHLVMPMVDLAIIHGGQGSVQTAVASGTSIIGFPLQTEQMFNLELIRQNGAGLNLPLQHLRHPEKIRAAVRTVLSDPRFKTNMESLRDLQKECDGPSVAAEALVRFVATSPGPTP
jgi:hypothetical protein